MRWFKWHCTQSSPNVIVWANKLSLSLSLSLCLYYVCCHLTDDCNDGALATAVAHIAIQTVVCRFHFYIHPLVIVGSTTAHLTWRVCSPHLNNIWRLWTLVYSWSGHCGWHAQLYGELATSARGHLWSSKMAPFDRSYDLTSYSCSAVTMALSLVVSEM